jgi:multiple antibiotic resistance protein
MGELVQAIAALLAITNPIGAAPVFATLTSGRSPGQRRKAAISVVFAVLVILAVATFAGEWILKAFGVTLPAFQAGGGLVVLLMGLEMLHGSPTKMQHANEHKDQDDERAGEGDGGDAESAGDEAGEGGAPKGAPKDEKRGDATKGAADDEGDDSIIVPLAMPMIAGPGTITTVITLTSHGKGLEGSIVVLIASAIVCVVMLATLFAAGWLEQKMSKSAETILLRFMGLVLVAIGAQLLLAGVKGFGVGG